MSGFAKCPLCGYEFNEAEAAASCAHCALNVLSKRCRLIRCPNCGYEMPEEPKIIKIIRERRSRRNELRRAR